MDSITRARLRAKHIIGRCDICKRINRWLLDVTYQGEPTVRCCRYGCRDARSTEGL